MEGHTTEHRTTTAAAVLLILISIVIACSLIAAWLVTFAQETTSNGHVTSSGHPWLAWLLVALTVLAEALVLRAILRRR
ncbi:MAG: hypothetical protein ACXVII_41705 [Solirubrobacteraceae bacterium]